jgi:hypothetical protein
MKTLFAFAWVAISVGLAAINPADAKGCIKGAIVGGVAGHMAGRSSRRCGRMRDRPPSSEQA